MSELEHMFTTHRQLRRIVRRKDVGLQLPEVDLSAAGALQPGIRDEIVRYESGPDRRPGAASIKQAFSDSANGVVDVMWTYLFISPLWAEACSRTALVS